jgi:hypothetical protein
MLTVFGYPPNEKAGLKPALLVVLDFRPNVRPKGRIAGGTCPIPARSAL